MDLFQKCYQILVVLRFSHHLFTLYFPPEILDRSSCVVLELCLFVLRHVYPLVSVGWFWYLPWVKMHCCVYWALGIFLLVIFLRHFLGWEVFAYVHRGCVADFCLRFVQLIDDLGCFVIGPYVHWLVVLCCVPTLDIKPLWRGEALLHRLKFYSTLQ